ncbi:hypothetical protein NQU36_26545, partial [Escherichia coli]|uniref:hypothetical protein n=1 Tax=Escherichia coli TaxID=562 RepID=UPI00211881B7
TPPPPPRPADPQAHIINRIKKNDFNQELLILIKTHIKREKKEKHNEKQIKNNHMILKDNDDQEHKRKISTKQEI